MAIESIDLTEQEIMECLSTTSQIAAERQAAEIVNVMSAAKQADALTNNVEFWKWIGQNYKCLSNPSDLQAVAERAPDWLNGKILQGKGYEWDFMTSQRRSFDKLFSRFDAGTCATQKGIDITEYSLLDGKVISTYQNKAYLSDNKLDLSNTPKDAIVVTGKEKVPDARQQGFETIEYMDNETITQRKDNRYEQAKKGEAVSSYTVKNVGMTMAKAGLIGAAISIGTETVFSFRRLKSGEITKEQYLTEIIKSGVEGGIEGAASAGIMIPIQASLTAAGVSAFWGIPIAVVVGTALNKIIAPAFGRGDYAKYLSKAQYYRSLSDMYVPLIYALDDASYSFQSFVDRVVQQKHQFLETSQITSQLINMLSQQNDVLSDDKKMKSLNDLISNI